MRNVVAKLISPEGPVRFLDHLVHESASPRHLERARHRFFMAPRLLFAGCALISAPIWLFLYGPPSPRAALIFLLAQTPLIAVATLARTGRLILAQSVSIFGWLALAAAFYADAGAMPASVTALTIALVETAVSAAGVAPIVLAEAAAVAAVAAGLGLPDSGGLETLAAFPLAAAPLLLYAPLVALCAVRAESRARQTDSTSARDLRLLTDALGDIVLQLDRSGAVAALIGDAHETYGLDRRDLIGRAFFQRVHIADRPAFLKLVSDVVAQGAPRAAVLRVQVGLAPSASGDYAEPVFNSFEARMRRAEWADDAREDASEAREWVVCMLRDVTATARAEEAITAARAESERAAVTQERFLANVSHELRTPLNAIIGFSEMLANPALAPADPVKQREYARLVADSGNHLLQIVNTILDMSKIEAGAMQLWPEPFSLPELLDECCDMMQLKADAGGVRLLRDYGRDLAPLVADKRACKQIMLNLLSNAVKFTPAGGCVGVRVAPEGNLLSLTVVDTGIGVAAADLSRLGDPFFQASATRDRAYEGTGLGLSVVRGLVGLHGGAIVIESAPRRGTAVTVRLPLDCSVLGPAARAAARIETIPRHGAAFGAVIRHDEETVKKIA